MRLPRPAVTLAGVGTVVLLAVGIGAGTSGGTSATAPVGVASQPITSADLVCASAASVKGVTTAMLSAAAPGPPSAGAGASGGSGTGTISVSRLGAPESAPPLAVAATGSPVLRYPVPVGKPVALVVRATGDYARGLTASVTSRTAAGAGRAVTTEQCTPGGSGGWFVGGGAAIGRRSVLYLTNIDAAPATVDVTVFTPTGSQQPAPVQGRTINPGKQYAIGIDALVPGAAATAVHVLTRSGRVAAALYDSQVNGLLPLGADWVPPTTDPSRNVVITGIPGDAGSTRTLGLVVPGINDAVVNVHLVTTDGTLSPDPLQNVSVPAGQLVDVDLSQLPTGSPFAVVVESDQPVVAGIRTVLPPGGTKRFPDFTYAAGTSAVAGGVLLPTVQHSATVTTELQLVAPGAVDVVVQLTTTTGAVPGITAGLPTSTRLTVPAGQTLQVDVGPLGPALSSVLVQTAPGAAPLYVGWVLLEAGVHGPLVTGGPVPQTPLRLVLPPVLADPAVGYPGH